MGYRLLIMLVLVLHFGFMAYLVIGGFLAWRRPWTGWFHLATATWAIVVVAAGLTCPLTYAEHWARRRAGETGVGEGFIDRYLEGVIYPERYAALVQLLVAVLVLVSWIGLFRRLRAVPRPRPRRQLRWRASR